MAPAQNLLDFLSGKMSTDFRGTSFKMGLFPADLGALFPAFITEELKTAFTLWKESYPTFISDHALLLGAETRTTCPLKISRNEHYESINTKNLYPIGEGSGYTGGITSSAVDGIKAVETVNSLKCV